MKKINSRKAKVERRHNRIRAKVSGTKEMPRLAVFRSNKAIYGQIIDDVSGTTLVSFSSDKAKGKTFLEKSINAGKEIAKLAVLKKINKIVFDRGGYLYTGKVKSFADGAREGGLKF